MACGLWALAPAFREKHMWMNTVRGSPTGGEADYGVRMHPRSYRDTGGGDPYVWRSQGGLPRDMVQEPAPKLGTGQAGLGAHGKMHVWQNFH